ncbi:hypothetical protein SLEP1_g47421 [Rubroshorea leprosula]|uniref:Transcription factor GAMYB-like n=1 Tax=Rubroshorea leprosula TaxID=152421 RepID=A0AAV5LQD0_9ROSI|nr:hypothetical protein SLEP1_g47421 [Rubroshorea leprosula]
MSHTTNESEDGMVSKDQTESPPNDDRNFGGSAGGGVVLKKGPWTSAEDEILIDYVKKHGEGNWNAVQKHSGLFRCGKSCRLRWANHLRPNLKKGAFTPEEEQLIIELHAKMGNKWARMAAHLPGRTDNEIKNYWNTRIKRRQRAGLPLYPPEVCLKALQESQNSSAINGGDKIPHDLLQASNFEIPDVIFDGLKVNQNVLSYVPELPAIPSSSMLVKGLGSSQYFSFMPPEMHCQKRLRDSAALFSGFSGSIEHDCPFEQFQDDTSNKVAQSFGLSFPVDPDHTTTNSHCFGVLPGSHTLSNGNYSASESPLGAVKLELPSLQYPEPELGSWVTSPSPSSLLENVDAFIQSPPPTGRVESDYLSPRNSGLLDALLNEAKILSSAKNHSCDKSSSSSIPGDRAESSALNICKTEWENYADSLSPMGHSTTSFFNECTPISASGSSLDEPSADNIAGSKVKLEPTEHVWTSEVQKDTLAQLDYHCPDTLFGSSWLQHGSGYGKDQAIMTDAIATLLGADYGSEYKTISPRTSSSQEWGLGSCAWNIMPGVCQMSELP